MVRKLTLRDVIYILNAQIGWSDFLSCLKIITFRDKVEIVLSKQTWKNKHVSKWYFYIFFVLIKIGQNNLWVYIL